MLTINNRDKIDWKNGMTIQGVLDAMGYEYVLITVTVNGEFVSKDDYETFEVPDDSEISVFHLAHGG